VQFLFEDTFNDSEEESKGESIGKLVQKLIDTTEEHELVGFCAEDKDTLTGCIFFSRFFLPIDTPASMLSPVAVSTQYQGKGIGQMLIKFGLEHIKSEGVELVVTYGAPAFYSKVGFQVITEDDIAPPYPLTYPHGWQAQSLVSTPLSPIKGETRCVEAFSDKRHW